jgi:probable F420-dependent oxidoreductase
VGSNPTARTMHGAVQAPSAVARCQQAWPRGDGGRGLRRPGHIAVRPFRFACRATGGQPRTATEWRDLAIRAEALGYDTFAVSDHFATAYAPLLVLQLVATCTSTLRLATLVLDNDFRHPAVLAKEAATLDVLCDGRLELGMGAGWLVQDYEYSGIPFEVGRVRVARLRESLQVLKLLFAGEPVSFSGRFWTLRGMELVPEPAQRPRPPLLVGGTGVQLLHMAAQEADIVGFDSGPATKNPASRTLAALAEKARLVRDTAASPDLELHLNPDVCEVTADPAQAVKAAARAAGIDSEGLANSAYVLAGPVGQIVEHLEAVREATGISYVTIRSDRIEDFAPIVAALSSR